MSALDRLNNSNQPHAIQYSVDDRLKAAESMQNKDDFLTMSDDAKSILSKHILGSDDFSMPEDIQMTTPEETETNPQVDTFEQPNESTEPEVAQVNTTPEDNSPKVSPIIQQAIDQTTPISQEVSQTESTVVNPIETNSITNESSEQVIETPEVPINTPTPSKRGRKPNKMQEVSQNSTMLNEMFIPVMNQLAKDLIDQLKKTDYKIARFNSEQMKILYDYMYTKF